MTNHPKMTALAVEFFARFARFEHALKEIPEFRNGDEDGVKPNWDVFGQAAEIAALYSAIVAAPKAQYLVQNPPRKRIVRSGILEWKDMPKPQNTMEVLVAIRRVRNNLFHGDKGNPNLSRNVQLFEACIAILDMALAANNDVLLAYEINQDIS